MRARFAENAGTMRVHFDQKCGCYAGIMEPIPARYAGTFSLSWLGLKSIPKGSNGNKFSWLFSCYGGKITVFVLVVSWLSFKHLPLTASRHGAAPTYMPETAVRWPRFTTLVENKNGHPDSGALWPPESIASLHGNFLWLEVVLDDTWSFWEMGNFF